MLLSLDFSSDLPIYLQIRNGVVLGIAEGRLAPGARLPSMRALADETGVNMMTVNKAYQLLKQEGFITTDRRSGAYVNVNAGDPLRALRPTLTLLLREAEIKGASREDILALCADILAGREGA